MAEGAVEGHLGGGVMGCWLVVFFSMFWIWAWRSGN